MDLLEGVSSVSCYVFAEIERTKGATDESIATCAVEPNSKAKTLPTKNNEPRRPRRRPTYTWIPK